MYFSIKFEVPTFSDVNPRVTAVLIFLALRASPTNPRKWWGRWTCCFRLERHIHNLNSSALVRFR